MAGLARAGGVPAGGMFPPVYPAPGLRRFSPLFYDFCDRTQGLKYAGTFCRLGRVPANLPARLDPMSHVLGGLHHLCSRYSRHLLRRATTGSKARTSRRRPFFSFWVNFLFCIRDFYAALHMFLTLNMFSHTASFLGAYIICMHHPSMFCVCPPPHFFFLLHLLLAYFSYLSVMCLFFLSFPLFLCPVYWECTRTSSLEGFLSGGLSFCLFSLSIFC